MTKILRQDSQEVMTMCLTVFCVNEISKHSLIQFVCLFHASVTAVGCWTA